MRDGKGGKDRVTMLPSSVIEPLRRQLAHARELHERDIASGHGDVEQPDALARKYPKAPYEWAWNTHVLNKGGRGVASPLDAIASG